MTVTHFLRTQRWEARIEGNKRVLLCAHMNCFLFLVLSLSFQPMHRCQSVLFVVLQENITETFPKISLYNKRSTSCCLLWSILYQGGLGFKAMQFHHLKLCMKKKTFVLLLLISKIKASANEYNTDINWEHASEQKDMFLNDHYYSSKLKITNHTG